MEILGFHRDLRSRLLAVVYAVYLIYPATMFVYDGIRSEYAALLLVLALVAVAKGGGKGLWCDLGLQERLVLVSFALISVIAWASYVAYDFPEAAKSRIEIYSWFALAVPVFSCFGI